MAAEVAEGHPGLASQLALKSIEAAPEIAADLIELIIKEGTKKRPDDDVIAAYGFLLTYGLEQLRFTVEREDATAITLADTLRTTSSMPDSMGGSAHPCCFSFSISSPRPS